MTAAVRTPTGLGSIAAISVRDAGNVLATVSSARIRDASNALKSFFGGFSAEASPDARNGFGNNSAAIDITLSPFTATPVGGAAPYTYAWEEVSSDSTWTITAPTSAETGFIAQDVSANSSTGAIFKCVVTDTTGAEAETNEVQLTAFNLGGGLM